MKRWIALLLVVVLTMSLALSGCAKEQKKTGNTLVDTYMNAARKYVEAGDYASAMGALEEGISKTKDEGLKKYLEEVKAMAAGPADDPTEPSGDAEQPIDPPDAPKQEDYSGYCGLWESDSFQVSVALTEAGLSLKVQYLEGEQFTADIKTEEIAEGSVTFAYEATSGSTGDCIVGFGEDRLTLEFANLNKNDAQIWIPEAIYVVKRAQTAPPNTPDTPDVPDAPDTPDVPDVPDPPAAKPQLTVEQLVEKYDDFMWAEQGIGYEKGGLYLEFYYFEGQGFGSGIEYFVDVNYVQAAPGCRRAMVCAAIEDDDLKGSTLTLDFDDDGWGNSGQIVICFVDDNTVTCEIVNFSQHPVARWGLNSSKKTLVKTSQVYDKLQGPNYGAENKEYWATIEAMQGYFGAMFLVEFGNGYIELTGMFFGENSDESAFTQVIEYQDFQGDTATFEFVEYCDGVLSGKATVKMTEETMSLTISGLTGNDTQDVLWEYNNRSVDLYYCAY